MAGLDRRIGGAFATDSKQVFVLHRGKVGGGREGVGRRLFWNKVDGGCLSVNDGNRSTEMAIVAGLQFHRFGRQLAVFVSEVDRIKALRNRSGGADAEGPRFAFQDYTDEYSGKRRYARTDLIEAECDHGIIIRDLRAALEAQGHKIGKDRFRDLYIHKGGLLTALFEAKSDSRSSVYSVVGQLLLHSANVPGRPKRVLVFPETLGRAIQSQLAALEFELLLYRWNGDGPDFLNIDEREF